MRSDAGGGDPVGQEWRCVGCDKLLGVIRGGRLHIRFARGHQYVVGLPASTVCGKCNALNEVTAALPPQERVGEG